MWTCHEAHSFRRMDAVTTGRSVLEITAAARDIVGAARKVLESLNRPGWPETVSTEVTVLTHGEAAMIMTYGAIGAAESMPEIRRVPPPTRDNLVSIYFANRSLSNRLGLIDTCGS